MFHLHCDFYEDIEECVESECFHGGAAQEVLSFIADFGSFFVALLT